MPDLRTPAIRSKTRFYIDDPFDLSEYLGDVNDPNIEFWCQKCRCPAEVDIDPLDGEVAAIRCPTVGPRHFHVEYVLLKPGPIEDGAPEWGDEMGYYDHELEAGWHEELDEFLLANPDIWVDTSQFVRLDPDR